MEEEPQSLPATPTLDYSSNVDTSRPFRSVKEAVAIFGERLLGGEMYSPKPYINTFKLEREPSWKFSTFSSPSPKNPKNDDQHEVIVTLRKLEAELEETKVELNLLKERESETEVALASLNAELHKNMSKLAEAEATAAGKAVATRSAAALERGQREEGAREEERRTDLVMRMETMPTLAEILSIHSEKQGYFGGKRERKMMKKKPIIPLVGDLFSRKKTSATTLHNPLFSSPQALF